MIFARSRQSVKPPFLLFYHVAGRLRISISVWHPWLSTLRTIHGCLYEVFFLLCICFPLTAIKIILAKTTMVLIKIHRLNRSTFIPFTLIDVNSVAFNRSYFLLPELIFVLTKQKKYQSREKSQRSPKNLHLRFVNGFLPGWLNSQFWPNDKRPFGQRANWGWRAQSEIKGGSSQ